ncbi:hypothetical protein [Actinoplanes sp. NBRC 101535]|uniref:hypothetical protein n=1 Tax=Actinoplanes sp. NBRC 101535 TaxID=3032196 RepID=UPI0024A0F96D|nr:hypothetical protein [Actinoplanes sp. NBRC 101535]GLY08210.1 hypothetical protein Acsp01_85890 [Actinoplanes sp. NBRC 101535]
MTATTLTITKLNENDPTQLFGHYASESDPQPVHLILDLEDGEMTCAYDGEPISSRAVPESVFCDRVRRYDMPALTAAAANRLLDEAAPLAERILRGSTIAWDGHNHVGRLDDDADAAEDELTALIAGYDDDAYVITELEAADYFANADLDVTADLSDAELAQLVTDLEKEARTSMQGPVVPTGFDDCLEQLREAARAEIREDLEDAAAAFDEARTQRDTLIRRVHGWGSDSLRQIAGLADVSHTQVDRIVKEGAGE